MRRRRREDREETYIGQNMTDISLSSLGMILLVFGLVAAVFRTAPRSYDLRAERSREAMERSRTELAKAVATLAEGERMSVAELQRLIREAVQRVEDERRRVEEAKEAVERRRALVRRYREAEAEVRNRRRLERELEALREEFERKKAAERTARRNTARDETGRPYFIYETTPDELWLADRRVSEEEFDALIRWLTVTGAGRELFAMRMPRGGVPEWVLAVFARHGWGPFVPALK